MTLRLSPALTVYLAASAACCPAVVAGRTVVAGRASDASQAGVADGPPTVRAAATWCPGACAAACALAEVPATAIAAATPTSAGVATPCSRRVIRGRAE